MKISSWFFLLGLVEGRALISYNGECGASNGLTCMSSIFGNCCSKDGTCGASSRHCGDGCQSDFGICTSMKYSNATSQDGTCGGSSMGFHCKGSVFGECCSQYGYCGNSSAYCDDGCDSKYGSCSPTKRSPALQERATPVGNATTEGIDLSISLGLSIGLGGGGATTTATATASASASASPTSSCVPCEGQPGSDPDSYCGYDINTDYYSFVPKTCRTVEYTFVVGNTTISPDGVPRIGLVINGSMPGPTIEANWGDTVKVHVINQMENNGTSIHFHGIRQNGTNEYDGVPSLTQCPIAPGESFTYEWLAESYGTSWYHSHFSLQAWEGVLGAIVIHGPSSGDYDVDAGPIVLQDWSHLTINQQYDIAEDATPGDDGGARVLDNGLINGMNTWGPDGSSNQTGQRWQMDVTQGTSYRLRVINVAIQSTFKFHIDGHKFTVISTDFTPIEPYETDILNINSGQRYDLIVTADQEVGSYWMRSDNQNACAGIRQSTDIKAVFQYSGASGTPTSTAYNYTSECRDEDPALHTPIVTRDASGADFTYDADINISNSSNIYRWLVSGTTFVAHWGDPTLKGIVDNGSPPDYSGNLLFEAPTAGEWVYVVIQSGIALPHPIHLHGHDFLVLAQGNDTYDSSIPLNTVNPSRRDTVLMPGLGYVVIAWEVDNPGVWLIHCHTGWHLAMGFAAQVVELQDQIKSTVDNREGLDDTCSAWNTYQQTYNVEQDDSGV
ncbi:Cupredoxin [Phyllosticta capitalensis]|uniref:Cupredoxin n=1 Tax=Phyllosticta capitalensis TaxID=121624 RepID=UPI0031301785